MSSERRKGHSTVGPLAGRGGGKMERPPRGPFSPSRSIDHESQRENAPANLNATQDHGYISDVQDSHSNKDPSEVSQDFYSSTKMLEQHFKDKYRHLKDAYEQRIRQLSEVVNKTCENFLSDDLISEMKGDRVSSAFIPAHLEEVIVKHLESDREQYIHRLVDQVSSLKVELLRCQENLVSRDRQIAQLEPEVARGRKSSATNEALSKKYADMKKHFDEHVQGSDEEIRALRAQIADFQMRERRLKEQLETVSDEAAQRTQELRALKDAHEDKLRSVMPLEMSFEKAVEDNLKSRLEPIAHEKNSLWMENQELKMRVKFMTEDLSRTQAALQEKTDEETQVKQLHNKALAEAQSNLQREIEKLRASMATMEAQGTETKERLLIEIQQEKRVNAVMNEELCNVRRDRDDKARDLRITTDEVTTLREKLAVESQKVSNLQLHVQELEGAVATAKVAAAEAITKARLAAEQILNHERLKEEELKVATVRAKADALKNLDAERAAIADEFTKKAEDIKRKSESQLKTLQNQLRHSYSFGSGMQEYYQVSRPQVSFSGGMDETALGDVNMSMFAGNVRSVEERIALERSRIESEHLVAKARFEAKLQAEHQEVVANFQAKLREAGKNIETLKQMVLKAKRIETEHSATSSHTKRVEEELEKCKLSLSASQLQIKAYEEHVKALQEDAETHRRRADDMRRSCDDTISDIRRDCEEKVNEVRSSLEMKLVSYEQTIANLELKMRFLTPNKYENQMSTPLSHSQKKVSDLEAELAHVYGLYEESKRQAMEDHARDTEALAEMSRKFEELVQNYEVNVSAVSHKLENSQVQTAHSEEVLEAQNSTIKSLEQALRHKTELLDDAVREVNGERTRANEQRKKVAALRQLLSELEHQSHTQIRQLHRCLSSLREEMNALKPEFASEVRKVMRLFTNKSEDVFSSLDRARSRDIQNACAALNTAHSSEIRTLEASYMDKFAAQATEHMERENMIRKELLERIAGVQGVSTAIAKAVTSIADSTAEAMIDLSIPTTLQNDSVQSFEFATPTRITRTPTKGIGSGAGAGAGAGAGKVSSPSRLELVHAQAQLEIQSHQAVLRGFLGTLNSAGLLTESESEQLLSLSKSSDQPDYIISSTVRGLLMENVSRFADKTKSLKLEIEQLQFQLKIVERERDRYEKENKDRSSMEASFIDRSENLSVASNRALDAAYGQLEQAREEQSMLLDLAKIEAESQVKALYAQIEDIKRKYELELSVARAETAEIESLVRRTMQEEVEAARREAEAALSEAYNELRAERSRSSQLQARLREIEAEYAAAVKALEHKVLEVQKRAELAELALTKAKMDSIISSSEPN